MLMNTFETPVAINVFREQIGAAGKVVRIEWRGFLCRVRIPRDGKFPLKPQPEVEEWWVDFGSSPIVLNLRSLDQKDGIPTNAS